MPAIIGETEVLNYLMKTGPIPLADLALRFDDPHKVLRALNNLENRGDILILSAPGGVGKAHLVAHLIEEINKFSPTATAEESYNFLMDAPETKSIVRLTNKGLRNIAG